MGKAMITQGFNEHRSPWSHLAHAQVPLYTLEAPSRQQTLSIFKCCRFLHPSFFFFFLLREISNMQTLKEYCEKPHILSLLSHVWSCFISLPPPPRFFQRKSKSLDYFICKQVTVTINKESCFEQNHIPLSP